MTVSTSRTARLQVHNEPSLFTQPSGQTPALADTNPGPGPASVCALQTRRPIAQLLAEGAWPCFPGSGQGTGCWQGRTSLSCPPGPGQEEHCGSCLWRGHLQPSLWSAMSPGPASPRAEEMAFLACEPSPGPGHLQAHTCAPLVVEAGSVAAERTSPTASPVAWAPHSVAALMSVPSLRLQGADTGHSSWPGRCSGPSRDTPLWSGVSVAVGPWRWALCWSGHQSWKTGLRDLSRRGQEVELVFSFADRPGEG